MTSRIVITLFVIGLLLFIIGMAIYWAIPTEYISMAGIVTTGSSVGLVMIVIGAVLMTVAAFMVDV
jgi:hypothetical protein